MKYFYRLLALVIVLCWGILSPVRAQNAPKTEPNTLVFKLKASAPAAMIRMAGTSALQQVVQRVAKGKAERKFPSVLSPAQARTTKKNAVDLSLIYQLRYNANQSFLEVKKQLLATGMVEYVEPLYVHEPLHQPNDPKADSTSGSQTYLKLVNAYNAWGVSKGDSNVVIGILDTGVRLTHEDLKNNLKYNYADPIDGIDNDGDGYVDNFHGWDLADNDNNPTADTNGHGTIVTGIAAAQANNSVGIAGIGYNSKFLPVKVFPSTPFGSFRGYEAIVYAAEHGCKVINLSWGGASFPSAFEQDVINYAAINRDVVIVSSAGNTNGDLDFYPASYQNVLSVGALDKNGVKGASHTYSYNIDLGALGVDVYSTGNANDARYGTGTGSSYATPMVAGAAALLRSHFPSLNALQIIERLRVTADDIYHLPGNASFIDKLGKGKLNVYRALTEENPISVRLSSWGMTSDSELGPGGEIQLYGSFQNFLSPSNGINVTLTSSSKYVQVLRGTLNLGSMATLAQTNNQTAPFRLKIADDAPSNTQVTLRLGFSSGSYTDYQYIKLIVNPSFLTTDVNNLRMSVMSAGNIGYDGLAFSQGEGVTYRGGDQLIAEGGLLIGYSSTLVSDNVRNENSLTDNDFYAVTNLQRKGNSPYAAFHGSNIFEDSLTASKNKSLRIQQNVFAWNTPSDKDYVVLEYILTNRTTETIKDAYAGMFADWDIISAGKNVTEWDDQLRLGITRHTSDTSIWAGIQVLTAGAPGFFALDNVMDDGNINTTDGFSTEEKYRALSGGVQRQRAGGIDGKDVSFIISSSISSLAPSQTDTVAFAIVAGGSRAEIKKNAAAALQKYRQFQVGRTVTSVPADISKRSISLHPNPSQGKVTVTLPTALQQASVTVQLVDHKGNILPQGNYQRQEKIDFDFSHLPAGMYHLRFISNEGVLTQKVLLTK
ncbi:T9SS C-terminal target domain-containing protein [Rufibacter immobilis]|uniref:T9SS C-terminal target domain-containing protein n=1 Tax=Rufibacter immobilis TaxID=1348778 RepID=A0A3M9MNL7_9BACT|nr:S8 family serine peptidase [Rufibacter immobilis]RNI27134.1 T9SS C-terminal target domain-containing protein [Rufibacter immobilis]